MLRGLQPLGVKDLGMVMPSFGTWGRETFFSVQLCPERLPWARDGGQGTGGSRQVVGLVYSRRQGGIYQSWAHRISKECVGDSEDIKQTETEGRGKSLLGTKVETALSRRGRKCDGSSVRFLSGFGLTPFG